MRVVAECQKTRGIEARHRIGTLNGPRCLTPFWRRRGPELEMVGITAPYRRRPPRAAGETLAGQLSRGDTATLPSEPPGWRIKRSTERAMSSRRVADSVAEILPSN